MRKFLVAAIAATTLGVTANYVNAQNQIERRVDRNLRQVERQAQRIGNQSTYYTDNTWKQVSPWVNKYDLRPVQRAANAVANTAVNAAANARFGFTQPSVANTQSGWFYDYYAMPYTNFTPRAGANNTYSSAQSFYDTNNDGVYDEFYTYRDSDNKGRYDEYDLYEFAEAKKESGASKSHDGLYDASRHTVKGKIDASKSAKVNGTIHTIVRVKGDKDPFTIVDLGPTEALSVKAEVGQEIVASGPLMQIGDKEVLVAESAQLSSKEVIIARSAPKMMGVVLDTTSADVQNGSHSLIVVKSENGNQLIDLGNADQLKVKIAPQTPIVVWGVPVQMRDHSVILADKIELNGQTHIIKRW